MNTPMQKNNSNQPVQYSKINTILLALLLILALGVFYVTTKNNNDEEIMTETVDDSNYTGEEFPSEDMTIDTEAAL